MQTQMDKWNSVRRIHGVILEWGTAKNRLRETLGGIFIYYQFNSNLRCIDAGYLPLLLKKISQITNLDDLVVFLTARRLHGHAIALFFANQGPRNGRRDIDTTML